MKYLQEKKHLLDYTENQPQDLLYDAYNLTKFPLREDVLLLFFTSTWFDETQILRILKLFPLQFIVTIFAS